MYTLQKEAVQKGEDPYQYSFPKESGSVLQFGGMTVEYNMDNPTGKRVVSVKIGGKSLDNDKLYTVATNNYAAENTDYMGLSESPILKEYGTCEEALKMYIGDGDFEKAAKTPCLVKVTATVPQEDEQEEQILPKPDEPQVQEPIPETDGVLTAPMAVCSLSAVCLAVAFYTKKKRFSI